MLYSHAVIFTEMAQANPTKHSLSRCNYNLYEAFADDALTRKSFVLGIPWSSIVRGITYRGFDNKVLCSFHKLI